MKTVVLRTDISTPYAPIISDFKDGFPIKSFENGFYEIDLAQLSSSQLNSLGALYADNYDLDITSDAINYNKNTGAVISCVFVVSQES